MTVNEQQLRSTTDAIQWALAFMDRFGDRKNDIDLDLMIGWFANAIEVGRSAGIEAAKIPRVPERCSANTPCETMHESHIIKYGECFVKSSDRYIRLALTESERVAIAVPDEPWQLGRR